MPVRSCRILRAVGEPGGVDDEVVDPGPAVVERRLDAHLRHPRGEPVGEVAKHRLAEGDGLGRLLATSVERAPRRIAELVDALRVLRGRRR